MFQDKKSVEFIIFLDFDYNTNWCVEYKKIDAENCNSLKNYFDFWVSEMFPDVLYRQCL